MIRTLLKRLFIACSRRFFWVSRVSKDKQPTLYLTFDDGPTAGITDRLVGLLDTYNAQATFFTIGCKLEANKALGGALVAAGHVVANHSLDHKGFKYLSLRGQMDQADQAAIIIETLSESEPRMFRAPQGNWSLALVLRLVWRGYCCVHWSYDSMDYAKLPVADIISQFQRKPVKNGDIILFHDDGDVCIEVLKVLLPFWQQQGFKFAALERK